MTKIDLVHQESQRAFELEWQRSNTQTTKAEKYIVAVGLIIGFELVKFPTILELSSTSQMAVATWLALISILSLFLSLVFCIVSMRTMPYLSYPRGKDLINQLKEETIDDNTAKIKVAKMYISARNKNASINDSRATLLSWGGFLLLGGFLLAIGSHFILTLFSQGVKTP